MSHPRHRIHGYSIEESIEGIVSELEYDAVGMWQIVPKGRDGFGLEGDELMRFVRRHIEALLKQGALPVRGVTGENIWIVQKDYGDTIEDVAESIIQEWLESGQDPDVGGLWFALPDQI